MIALPWIYELHLEFYIYNFSDVKKEEISYLKAKSLVVTGFTEEDQVQTTLDKL